MNGQLDLFAKRVCVKCQEGILHDFADIFYCSGKCIDGDIKILEEARLPDRVLIRRLRVYEMRINAWKPTSLSSA